MLNYELKGELTLKNECSLILVFCFYKMILRFMIDLTWIIHEL